MYTLMYNSCIGIKRLLRNSAFLTGNDPWKELIQFIARIETLLRINFKTIPLEFSKLESAERTRTHSSIDSVHRVFFIQFIPRGRSFKTLTGMFFKANRKKQYHWPKNLFPFKLTLSMSYWRSSHSNVSKIVRHQEQNNVKTAVPVN